MTHWLPNAIGYQVVWFAAVAGAGRGWWWAGPAAFLVFAAWQLAVSDVRRADAVLLVAAGAVGFTLDSLWAGSGLLRYATPVPSATFAPVWIVALWMAFALTLNHSLALLKTRIGLGLALGALGGPLAYAVAAHTWNAVAFGVSETTALLSLALGWSLALPALLLFAQRLAPLPRKAFA